VDGPGTTKLGDPDDLTDMERVVMRDVQQHLGHRLVPVVGRLDESLGRERAENRIDPPPHVGPHLQHVGFRRSPTRGKLGIAIANERRSPNDVLEEMTIRSRNVQHEVANRIRLLMRTPPEIVLAQHLETAFDLSGEFRDQTSGEVLEEKCVDRIGHLVMISSNVHVPQPGHTDIRSE
jgi:hypothetical protein